MWSCIFNFNQIEQNIMLVDLKKIDASKTIEEVDQCFRDVTKAIRNLKESMTTTRDLAEQVKVRINEFKKHSDLLLAIRNPAMRKRHWIQLSKLIGQDMRQLRYINGVETKNYG